MSAEMTFPNTWKMGNLSQVAQFNPKQTLEDDIDVGFMPMANVPTTFAGKTSFEIKKWKDVKKGYTHFKDQDVIFAKITPCFENSKATVITNFPNGFGAGSTEYYVLRGFNNLTNPFLFLALVRTADFLINGEANMSGSVGHKRVTKDFVENYPFPIIPLAEQHQIAQKLDELLAQVDTIKAHLDAIPAILKRFRQSVLSAAVSGKLTEELRDNTDYKSHEFSEKWKWHELPSSWNVNFFENIVDCRLGKMLDKAKNFGKQTKYLGNINVRWFHFELTNLQEILVTEKEQFELSLAKGDLLICEGGEPGRCAIWSEKSDEPIIFQKALHRARVKDAVIPEWIAINLKNDCDNQILEQLFTGTTIKHLTGKALKKYPLRLPPINEQTEIVRQVDRFFTFADQIEQRVNDAKARVDKLTQSILAKAFRGELTADWRAEHPELISGENSAEALLAKIQTAKEALGGKKKKGKAA